MEDYMTQTLYPMTEKEETVPRAGFFTPLFRGSVFGMNPFALIRKFAEEMDREFGAEGAFTPAIEVKQKEGKLFVTADLPGIAKEDVKVYVEGDALVLEGERKREKEEKREGFFRSERVYGKFCRTIPLPEGANPDQAAATFKNGVLEVTLPVAEVKPKAKQIPVQEAPREKLAA
jgi:HSP20 family protein